MKGTLKRTTAAILAALLLATAGTATVAMAETSAALTASEAEGSVDTITLPNGEVREIETIEPAVTALLTSLHSAESTLSDAENEEDEIGNAGTVNINSLSDFKKISTADWYSNKTFVIKRDLDVSSLFDDDDEWTGAITYFLGKIVGQKKANGQYPTISGIPTNCAFIYGIIGGNIENINFDYGDSAAFITLLPIKYGSTSYPLTVKNVTVTGSIALTGSDQSNYSPFVYCASTGGLVMEDCISNVTMSGPIYGSVFYGYYPIQNANYSFINCINNGAVNFNYAGMFFGNSTNIESKLSSNNITLTIQGCENRAPISGVQGAKYLAAPVTSDAFTSGSSMDAVEQELTGKSTENELIEAIQSTVDGILISGVTPTFSAAIDNDGTIVITPPTSTAEGESVIDYYDVSIGVYVNLWDNVNNEFFGTDRVSKKARIYASEFEGASAKSTGIKVLDFCDSNLIEGGDSLADCKEVTTEAGETYYVVNNTIDRYEGRFKLFISSNVDTNGTPTGDGTKSAQFVTVSAYGTDGKLISIYNVLNPLN
jgi:hypothetical protein